MTSKAKIVLENGDYVIADMSVNEVKTALAAAEAGSLVEIDVTKKVYDTTLNTIEIDKKQVPAYQYESVKKYINPAQVQMVAEASVEEAKYYTGVGELPDENSDSEEDGGEG